MYNKWLSYCHIVVGEDYIEIDNDTITFQVDELRKTVSLILLDNDEVEDMEKLEVTITPVPGLFPVTVQNSTAMISISDNDGECNVVL